MSNSVYHKSLRLLTEEQFVDFIVLYFKNIYRTNEVVITDGPYDGGQDLVCFINGQQVKTNIQVTIQQSNLKNKILKDAEKAKENVERFAYLSNLVFCSREDIPNDTQNQAKKDAKSKYGINVDIFDGKRLAAIINAYPDLQSFLAEVLRPLTTIKSKHLDTNTKLLYDVLSRQADITDIKHSLIRSCFISCLYHKGSATVAEISNELDCIFCGKIKHSYYEYLAGSLYSKGEIVVANTADEKRFKLSAESTQEYNFIELQTKLYEAELQERMDEISQKYGISLDVHDIFSLMNSVYDSVYANNLSELPSEYGKNSDPNKIISDFIETRYSDKITDVDACVLEIVNAFETNDLFGKESLSRLFISLFNDEKLEQYISSSSRVILLDTPVLLRWICLMINRVPNYSEPYYTAVKQLREAVYENSSRVTVITMDGYLNECVILIRKAIRLSRFENLISLLGPSNNVFFNYYQEVCLHTSYDSCEDFIIQCLDVDNLPLRDEELDVLLMRVLKDRLRNVGISVMSGREIDTQEPIWRDFEVALVGTSGEKKSHYAKVNDLQAILYMHENFSQNHHTSIVTSDTSFNNVRKMFTSKYGDMDNWLIYSPQNMAKNISVEQFRIDLREVSNSIRFALKEAIIENSSRKGIIDLINDLTSNWTSKDMYFANRVSALRDSLKTSGVLDRESEGNSIDEVIMYVLNYLRHKHESKEKLILMVDDDEYMPKLKSILQRYIPVFREHNVASYDRLKIEIDSLLDSVEIYEEE